MEKIELEVSSGYAGKRLDVFIAASIEDISRAASQRLIEEGCVTVNGRASKVSQKLELGQVVACEIPPTKPAHAAAEEIPLDIVFEDEDLIVLNKPRGMVVHPAPGAESGTLVNALLAHCNGLSTIGGVERPGIVHRLDKDTTGLLVVAKNDVSHRNLQEQIQTRNAERRYLALVWGNPRFEQAIVDAPIGRHPVDRKKMAVIEDTDLHRAREASTKFSVQERFGSFTLMDAKLETGRTHQVRVHAAYAGHPVVGDPAYSGNRRLQAGRKEYVREVNQLIDKMGGQALHAYKLSFNHPRTKERLSFTRPLPLETEALVVYLRDRSGE